MVNTYNESNLHLTLKKLYAMEYNAHLEVKIDGTEWICDILDEEGNAIEIQTSNLSALTEKVQYLLEKGKKVKIVHPVIREKYIETYSQDGRLTSRKKSPKKGSIYDSLRGMTSICPLFLNPLCTLEILEIRATQMRRQTEEPVQLENKARKHLKSWVPAGKRLEEILLKKQFGAEDFLELLCVEEKEEFRLCDVQKGIKKAHGVKTSRWASMLVWILLKMNLIHIKEIKGRSKVYSV